MYMLDQSEWLRAYKGSGPHKIRHLCLQGNTYLSVPAVVSNTLPTNRAQKAVSEFDAFASHFAGESGFVKRTTASRYNYQAVLQRFEQSLDPSFRLRTVRRDPFDPQLPERSSEMRTGFFSPQLFPP